MRWLRILLVSLPLGALFVASCSESPGSDSTHAGSDGGALDARDEPRNVFVDGLPSACLARSLDVTGGSIPCALLEAVRGQCSCDATLGRTKPNPDFEAAVRQSLSGQGLCGGATGIACTEFCVCEIVQLEGSDLNLCQTDAAANGPSGFCYVDPQAGIGSAELVADCPDGQKRKLRFLGAAVPEAGVSRFIGCSG